MQTRTAPWPATRSPALLRVGSVSFLNAKPLIEGLDTDPSLRLSLDVPSRLLDGMLQDRFDVSLLPVIDYQRMPGLRLLTAGGIGCDGPTLTVRIFSPVPVEQIQTLACDGDSHTSVALARILLAELYGLRPRLVDLLDAQQDPRCARLLIGDKVVCEAPEAPHQLDLGEAWKRLTGLPFVFAAWMARQDVDLGELSVSLRHAKARGLANIEQIIEQFGIPRGWPPQVARQYLTENLKFDIGPRELLAIRQFHELAARHRIIPAPPRELIVD